MPKVKLNDVAIECRETIKGETGLPVVGLEHLIPGEVCLTQWSEDSDNTFTKRFRKGQVLFGRRRAYLKKAAVAPFDGICSGDITVIAAKPDVLEPELLPFIIQNDALFDYAVGHSAGSLSPRVKWEHLKNYEFQLSDRTQQRELSHLLWAVEDTRRAYQTLIQRSEELVKSQFIEMFTNKQGEKYITLAECCDSIAGGSTPSMKHEEFYGGNVPFIKSGDVKEAYVSSGALWLTDEALHQTTAKYVPMGAIIVVIRSGILKHTLPVAIATRPVVINQDLKAFVPKHEFLSQYLAWAIRSKEDALLSRTRAMTVDNIESNDLFSIPVMVASIKQQQEFSSFVEQLDKSKFVAQKATQLLQCML